MFRNPIWGLIIRYLPALLIFLLGGMGAGEAGARGQDGEKEGSSEKRSPTREAEGPAPDFLGEQGPRAQLLLLGTFHFNDQGLDSHKPEIQFNVQSGRRQKEIAEVLERLAAFNPTKIAVEVRWSEQARLDESYRQYRAGERDLSPSETHQLGFRLGGMLEHDRLYAVDARGRSYEPDMTEEEYNARVQALMAGVDPEKVAAEMEWDRKFEELYDWEDALESRISLREALLFSNRPENLQRHHGHYLVGSFKLGRDDDYFGVDMKTRWYNRNLRIFQNLQRITDSADERILLVIGNGHVPILRHAALSSPEYKLVEVSRVLGARR